MILNISPALGVPAALDIVKGMGKSLLISLVNLQFFTVVVVVIHFNILLGAV